MDVMQPGGYQRILVPTDFSPPAQAALRQAVWVAEKCQAKLVLAHVLTDLRKAVAHTSFDARLDLLRGEGEVFERELRKDSDRKLQKLIGELGPTKAETHYETLLGEPFVEIIHSVLQENYDLVVTGTRGMSTLPGLFLGSTAKRLIRKCPCSVWVVKGEQTAPHQSILVAVDMSDVSRRAFAEACRIATWSGAELHVLHAIDAQDVPKDLLDKQTADAPGKTGKTQIQEAAEQHFDAFLRSAPGGLALHKHLAWGTPWREIRDLAGKLNSPLIVMGTVGRTGMRGVLIGNTAEKVLTHCDASILTIKPAGFVSPIQPADWPLHPGPASKS
jgi:nucleotide-binding universal stress UspA family protein